MNEQPIESRMLEYADEWEARDFSDDDMEAVVDALLRDLPLEEVVRWIFTVLPSARDLVAERINEELRRRGRYSEMDPSIPRRDAADGQLDEVADPLRDQHLRSNLACCAHHLLARVLRESGASSISELADRIGYWRLDEP